MSIKLEQQGVMKGVLKGLEMFEVKGGAYNYDKISDYSVIS